jgi:glycosyltransferase involved in cell wall biosynthesis
MARSLGVADRIEFLGWVPREQLRALMAERADIFIFPSLHDDAPFAVAEALAAHVPVVCLDRGGPPVLGGTPVATSGLPETVAALAEGIRTSIGMTPSPYPDLTAHASKLRSILQEAFSATALPGRLAHPSPGEEVQS